jgi:hypothetical protein
MDNNIITNNDVHDKKQGEIEMTNNEPYIDYNDYNDYNEVDKYDQSEELNKNDHDNESDKLSEFSEYKDNEFYSDDELESCFDFNFDFDIIFTPENNNDLLQLTEIKSKIVNRIKLNALDLQHIKNLGNSEQFDIIRLFNHMV